MNDAVLRLGALGAARITPHALIKPAGDIDGVRVAAVAARDPERARAFATKHGIPRVLDSYDALLADPDIDAVYNPLPNSLHAEWTIKALDAGKHVLCEKPFTSNAAEAEEVAAVADRTGLVVMEAFHYRYHPLAERMQEVVTSGALGAVRHIETWMCVPLAVKGDIRYKLDLAGGATMDVGAYSVHMLRLLAGAEPDVVSAAAKLSSPGVDRAMAADFRFADGRTGHMTCSMFSRDVFRIAARVTGDDGEMRVFNPVGAHYFTRLKVRTSSGVTRERVGAGTGSTYHHQLRAFLAAVRDGGPVLTPPSDSIATMRVIDAVYRAAGMEPRGSSPS
jgi:predicted dehydrogenase